MRPKRRHRQLAAATAHAAAAPVKNEGVVPYATECTSPGPATKSASQLSFAAAKCTRPLGLWIGCSGSPPLAPVVFAFVNVKSAAPPDTVLLNSDVAMRIESPVLA